MAEEQPTTEELQNTILDMQAQIEELKANNDSISVELNETKTKLADSQDINAKLWKSVKSDAPIITESEPVEMSKEDKLNALLDDAMEPTLKQMRSIYGVDKVGYQ